MKILGYKDIWNLGIEETKRKQSDLCKVMEKACETELLPSLRVSDSPLVFQARHMDGHLFSGEL